jgi:hypothetical protein
MDVNTEAEDIVEDRHQAMTDKDIEDCKDLLLAVVFLIPFYLQSVLVQSANCV